jgi:hypothetical protein
VELTDWRLVLADVESVKSTLDYKNHFKIVLVFLGCLRLERLVSRIAGPY